MGPVIKQYIEKYAGQVGERTAGRVAIAVALTAVGFALWWPFTAWEGPNGARIERWGLLGFREVWVGHIPLGAGRPDAAIRPGPRQDRLVATAAISMAIVAAAFAGLRALEEREYTRRRERDLATQIAQTRSRSSSSLHARTPAPPPAVLKPAQQ